MDSILIPPANMTILGVPGSIIAVLIPLIGIGTFGYIMARRLIPLAKGNPDPRFDQLNLRIKNLFKYWLAQYKQPRYMLAGVLHILIFAGFIILSIRSISLVFIGFNENFVFPGLSGFLGDIYNFLKDYAATIVLIACIAAAIRRGVFKPERYKVPAKYGHEHTFEAIFVLALIGGLMVFESLFGATHVAAQKQHSLEAEFLAPGSLAWMFSFVFSNLPLSISQSVHTASYFMHDIIFFFFLCYLPFGKHFHVITSIFNVFFMKLEKGSIKPVKWGITEDQLDEIESFGVKYFEDFTWKHMLDFYTCVDCGRCSDNCPANAVGRPLSPRFISIKSKNYMFDRFPVWGDIKTKEPVIGKIFEEDEIWSCTTCGACEEECPVLNEYIDKIVDLRRGMVDKGNVPQSLQKPLGALEKRGNPYGKMEKKRVEWISDLSEEIKVKTLGNKESAANLYFVDSATSYDERLQEIAKATTQILHSIGTDFGILGKSEKDSGHEVRRFGEEMLFQTLKDENTEAILNSNVKNIITADPHAYNALKKDYSNLPPIEHISQFIFRNLQVGNIYFEPLEDQNLIFTYHDPCYLGRHNQIYDPPRVVLDAIPGLKRVEMSRSGDRSFCCGGGGLMLFYEPIEDRRMGQSRAEMAAEAGANVIITCCPFCLINLEDGIKTSGLEDKVEVMDLTELVVKYIVVK